MTNNIVIVKEAMQVLLPHIARYITDEFKSSFSNKWKQVVYDTVSDSSRESLSMDQSDKDFIDSVDLSGYLRCFDQNWNNIFRLKLSMDYRNWAKELMGIRNKVAHSGSKDFSEDDTWRALDTIARLCDAFDDLAAEQIRGMLRKVRYGSEQGSAGVSSAMVNASTPKTVAKDVGVISKGLTGLPCWRDIIEPHPDVAQGRYKNAEFAADLAQVARGEGSYEYRDPVEFFARTYVTEGMHGLLLQALKRIAKKDGEPVIQLKTAFGGGKTHSMLALYHLLRGKTTIDKVPNVKFVLDEVGMTSLPKVNTAVLVGTAIDPTKSRRPQTLPGITVNTLWGEMAAQLAESAGKPKLYDYVKEADKKGVSPGSEAFKNLFNECGPCLILMDELVAYAKKLYGQDGLPAGSFDNFITFIQEITEAARASENSLVVASIPESEIEIGGEAGKQALEAIEHTFGRMESIWKPVNANEGFEVVRRRLFLDCKKPDERDAVCNRFSQMYLDNASDFPIETKEVDYCKRMISCYPIHPEVFDRLYSDWSTLERFQRTRGVLRLMASVIHELWIANDAGALIMPGSLPLGVSNVAYELTRYLPDDGNWNAIIDTEVDGTKSTPYKLDKEVSRYGRCMAARRVTRTVFLGSAPTSRGQNLRGVEASRIRLGVVQPGETISDFNDALGHLQNRLSYFNTNGSNDRFWYDTRPTLRKTVEDRATQISQSDVEYEIEHRLRAWKKEGAFSGIHVCPQTSLDVPDEQNVRLVVLHPNDTHKQGAQDGPAITTANEMLMNRGSTPRQYRNMLAFVAPDRDNINYLKQEVRRYLAWESIKNDKETLNLDAAQVRETENNLKRSAETVELKLKESYCWLLVPRIDADVDMKAIVWEENRLGGGTDSVVQKASKKMLQNEALITDWAPMLLKMELDNLLWKDSESIQVKKLWEYLTTYCYLPRIANYGVLERTIHDGVASDKFFAFAAGLEDGKYVDLTLQESIGLSVHPSAYLVKVDVAQKQIEEDRQAQQPSTEPLGGVVIGPNDDNNGCGGDSKQPENTGNATNKPAEELPTHFYMSKKVDNVRIFNDIKKLVDEIVQHLTQVKGASVEVSLDVNVNAPNGIPQDVVRTVNENCMTLKVDDKGFD